MLLICSAFHDVFRQLCLCLASHRKKLCSPGFDSLPVTVIFCNEAWTANMKAAGDQG